MKSIQLGEGLALPLDVVTQKLAFLARSGAGKSYAAGVLVEGLLSAKLQVVIVDPVGVWHGLRLGADGRSPGFSIPVLGGEHGDIQLESTSGALIAGLVAEKGLSLVLDVSDFNGAEQRKFVTEFAVALHKLKKSNRSPVMVVWEECQDFVPQRVSGESARMVGAMERLIKQGRNFGVGTTLISQRPQAVNKDVLNQTEVLIVLQTTGPQERKAIEGWVQHHGLHEGPLFSGGDALGSVLPKLPIGTALVWSPQWLRVFKRVAIGKKTTFDASATPTFGARKVEARALEPVELGELREAMAATIERTKAEDPKYLHARIRELESKLRAAEAQKPVVERVEVPVLTEKDHQRIEASAAIWQEAARQLTETAALVRTLLAPVAGRRATIAAPRQVPAPRPARAAAQPRQQSGEALSKAERKVLTALAQYPDGRTKSQLAILSGYAVNGGGFNNACSAMRTRGYIEGSGESMRITEAGLAALGPYDPLPHGHELLEHWRSQLGKAEREVLDVLVRAYPGALPKDVLAEQTESGYAPDGGGFNNALSRLRTLELVSGRGELRASDDLFGAST